MIYRENPKTHEKVSLLGFGAMRLPTEGGKVVESEAIRMIRYAIDNNINYVDTAFPYHDGVSEEIVGKALKDGYRERIFLADKLPVWNIKEHADCQKTFDVQRKRLGEEHIDYYLVHGVDDHNWEAVQKHKILDFMTKMKDEGSIDKVCFSYHGLTTELFKSIIDIYPWDMCQIQINYMDRDIQAGLEGMRYAASKDIAVVIMEPIKGGKLAMKVPEQVTAIWERAEVKRTPAEWALRWVADFPEVMTILSGMSTFEQVCENIRILGDAEPNSLTPAEHALIDEAAEIYRGMTKYGCTGCRYCMPCPSGLEIPKIIDLRNDVEAYGMTPIIRGEMKMLIDPKPTACTECGKCVEMCPQHLAIPDIMSDTCQTFGL